MLLSPRKLRIIGGSDWNSFRRPVLNLYDCLGPIVISILVGTVIGYFNETNEHFGGGRTYAIICGGSALVALTSRVFFLQLGWPMMVDPGRLSAQIIPAMIFLTSGLVLFTDSRAMAPSSVSTLWVTSLIGMMLGSGMGNRSFVIAVFMVGCVFLILKTEQILERKYGATTSEDYSKKKRTRWRK